MNSGETIVIGGITIGIIALVIIACILFLSLLVGVFLIVYFTKVRKQSQQTMNGTKSSSSNSNNKLVPATKNEFLSSDIKYISEFVEMVFEYVGLTDELKNEKIQVLFKSKENKGETLIDIKSFFKNDKYILLPFHTTPDPRFKMILYYCQTRASHCLKMPSTKYSSSKINNYLAYFPIESYDDMCFIAYLMTKEPYVKGVRIHGFESGLTFLDLDKYEHDKDFVYEYIYRMIIDYSCESFPIKNALLEVTSKELSFKYSSLQAEIKAEMQREGLVDSGLHNENERKLFFLVKEIYPDAIYQYRDKWLGNYSLDIYIPSIKTAIEYQGGQHYSSVKFYGGQKTFEETQTRDQNKRDLCAKKGIRLIEWNYENPVTKEELDKAFYK